VPLPDVRRRAEEESEVQECLGPRGRELQRVARGLLGAGEISKAAQHDGEIDDDRGIGGSADFRAIR